MAHLSHFLRRVLIALRTDLEAVEIINVFLKIAIKFCLLDRIVHSPVAHCATVTIEQIAQIYIPS